MVPLIVAIAILQPNERETTLDQLASVGSREAIVCTLVLASFRRLLRQEGAFLHQQAAVAKPVQWWVLTLHDFFFSSLAERAITAVPVTALPLEAIVTSSAMPRFHQAESNNKRKQNKQQPSKTNNATPTRHKPKTKHLSGN